MKKIALVGATIVLALSLASCGTVVESATTKTTKETLQNGGTIECVIAGAQSGTVGIYCIDATYIPPTKAPATVPATPEATAP